METQLFTWGEYDILADLTFQFYNCTLKVDIGRLPKGEVFESIIINYEIGYIEIQHKQRAIVKYDLSLTVGGEIQ
jgi:hypothetical protein